MEFGPNCLVTSCLVAAGLLLDLPSLWFAPRQSPSHFERPAYIFMMVMCETPVLQCFDY